VGCSQESGVHIILLLYYNNIALSKHLLVNLNSHRLSNVGRPQDVMSVVQ
jgi:hypothetical protein